MSAIPTPKDKTTTPRDSATQEVIDGLLGGFGKAWAVKRSGGGHILVQHNDTTNKLEYSEDGGATWVAYW